MTRLFDACPYFSTDKNGTVVILQPKVSVTIQIYKKCYESKFLDYYETSYW